MPSFFKTMQPPRNQGADGATCMPSDKLCHIFAQKEGVADPHRQRPQESDVILKPQNQLGKQLKTAGEED